MGIVGKDILTEASADVYELLDTVLGRCRMCVAAPADYKDDPSRPVRVAVSYTHLDVYKRQADSPSTTFVGLANASTPLVWLGVIAYSLQLYFDFSGYSLMAIGMGKMLGFDFPQNFNLSLIHI